MSKLAQRQRNQARRQVQGHRQVHTYTVKNTGTRKTVTLTARTQDAALTRALALGLAKSLDKLVVVA